MVGRLSKNFDCFASRLCSSYSMSYSVVTPARNGNENPCYSANGMRSWDEEVSLPSNYRNRFPMSY